MLSHKFLALNTPLGDQILSHHLSLEVVISTADCDVNATDCEVSKEITKIVWDEKNKEEFMRATGNKYAQHKLSEATNLINDNLEEAIETFNDYLTLVSRCMQKTHN